MNQKRKKAALAILAAVGGSGMVIAIPIVNIEVPKQVFMTVADVAMYTVIWDIYFDEELSQKDTKSILVDLSLITLISAGTAYVTAKGATALISEITNLLGAIGWGVVGVIAGVVTGLVGVALTFYCDDLYRNPSR